MLEMAGGSIVGAVRIGWSGTIGACWLWGASSARSTRADYPLLLAKAQFPELSAVLITRIAHGMCQVQLCCIESDFLGWYEHRTLGILMVGQWIS